MKKIVDGAVLASAFIAGGMLLSQKAYAFLKKSDIGTFKGELQRSDG